MTPILAEAFSHRSRFIWLFGALAATLIAYGAVQPKRIEIRKALPKIGNCNERRVHHQVADTVRAPVAADLALYTRGLDGRGKLLATIVTSKGTLHCELFSDSAPIAVANFVGLATGQKAWKHPSGEIERGRPFYNGLTFHRVIPKFVIQGGDPIGNGTGGPGYQFANEIDPQLDFEPGMLAMANNGSDASNGSQYFITEESPEWLAGRHTIFGRCLELDVVKQIARVPATSLDHPIDRLVIETVTISRN
jgi:peptidyl-prolyl cis-trans isomerase A (cyclophilin A)